MIDVPAVLGELPHFECFCSVKELQEIAEGAAAASSCSVEVIGRSQLGRPIHHVRFGQGAVKALFVAFPHPNEPIGGLTAFSLIKLLGQRHSALVNADVEWHIVPCIDPDGALLNEGWTLQPFTFGRYMRNSHRQELRDQVEASFPVSYKRLYFNEPTSEAGILQELLSRIQPDFYTSLHNLAVAGPAFFGISHDLGAKAHEALHALLLELQIPLQSCFSPAFGARTAVGIKKPFSIRQYYDFLEATTPAPEELLPFGACSWEYLAQIKENAVSFYVELPYLRHPSVASRTEASGSVRHFKLKSDTEQKFVAAAIFEEWDRIAGKVDANSPFYRKVFGGVISQRGRLHEGLPAWPHKTRDLLFNPGYSRPLTEADRFEVVMERFFMLSQSYEFVRLLKESSQTPEVCRAIQRMETLFDEQLAEIDRLIDFRAFKVIELDTLVRAQLGCTLIALNSLLESQPSVPHA